MSITTLDRGRLFPREWTAAVSVAIFLLIASLRLCVQYMQSGAFYIEDDAHYYTVIARNIAQSGISTFDGQTLTNGYHPLWLLLLVIEELTLGGSPAVTILAELLLAAAGLWLFIVSFRTDSILFRVAFAVLYTLLAWPMIAKGMEISLLLFALGLFTRIAAERREGKDNALALGLAAILCIGARLDAAVFVIPVMILASGGVRRSLLTITPVVIAGALYAGVNLWLFGSPFPISGAIKSLGGWQLNRALLDQAASYWHAPGMLKPALAFMNSFIGRPILFFVLAGLGFILVEREWKSWPLGLGYLIGFVLFAVKLLGFSSWAVWPWYAFPAIIGLAALFHMADDYLFATKTRLNPRLEIAAAAIVLLCAGWQQRAASANSVQSFESINLDAVAKFGPILNGARVAMGDRSGSFASHYAGPVTQLEGLVNDRAYLEALQRHDDIRPLLCARGVRYILSYQRDLGDYDKTAIPVLRYPLTHFPSPALTFSRSDEIGRVFDLTKYDNSPADEGDNYLYAWRLSGCAGASRAN